MLIEEIRNRLIINNSNVLQRNLIEIKEKLVKNIWTRKYSN